MANPAASFSFASAKVVHSCSVSMPAAAYTARALPQSPGAGDDRCDDHADDEQRDACRPVQPIVFELYAGHRVQSLDHQQQERRNAEEADHQSQSAAD